MYKNEKEQNETREIDGAAEKEKERQKETEKEKPEKRNVSRVRSNECLGLR